MRIHKKLTFTLLTLVFASAYLAGGCKAENSSQPETTNKNAVVLTNDSINCTFITFPADEITTAEVDMIKYMREEEKLARDVYTTFSAQYTLPVFKNIPQSEQRHMDFILCLLNQYNITDPASDEIGVFNNSNCRNFIIALSLKVQFH